MANVKSCHAFYNGSEVTKTATFASPVTAGGVVYVAVFVTNGGSINTPTDDAFNTYTALDANDNGGLFTKAFYAKNVSAGAGNLAVTVTTTGNVYGFFVAHELSGRHITAPLGGNTSAYQTAVGTGTDAVTTTAVASGDGYDVVSATTAGFTDPGINPGTGFASGETPSLSGGLAGRSESLTQSGAGTRAGTFTSLTAASNFNTHVATFAPVAASPQIAIPVGAIVMAGLAPSRSVFDPLANDARLVIRQS